MDWSLVVFLGMGMVSFLIFIGMIVVGSRKASEYIELQKSLGKKAINLDSNTKELWKALEKSEEEKGKILERLRNLEAIVTSEAYEAIKSGNDSDSLRIHLQDETLVELDDSDKAAEIAKRVR